MSEQAANPWKPPIRTARVSGSRTCLACGQTWHYDTTEESLSLIPVVSAHMRAHRDEEEA